MAKAKKIHAWIPYLPEGARIRGNTVACQTGNAFRMTHNPRQLTCKRCDTPEIRRQMRDG